jgi:hypothetical protein
MKIAKIYPWKLEGIGSSIAKCLKHINYDPNCTADLLSENQLQLEKDQHLLIYVLILLIS